jgi:hypothetical protein
MDSVELYRPLPGLTAPWTVERAELDVARQQVDVHVGQTAGRRFACPERGRELGVYDYLAERGRRHLDRSPFLACLHTPPPRVSRPEHGSRIANVRKRACGYRNPNHFRIAVHFHCSGLDLHPAAVTRTKVG